MFKKIIFIIYIFFGITILPVKASEGSLVKIGNKYYETIAEAIENIDSEETISLISDVKLDNTLELKFNI